MAIREVHTCDRCGASENISEEDYKPEGWISIWSTDHEGSSAPLRYDFCGKCIKGFEDVVRKFVSERG